MLTRSAMPEKFPAFATDDFLASTARFAVQNHSRRTDLGTPGSANTAGGRPDHAHSAMNEER
jgi:hypothetical protein